MAVALPIVRQSPRKEPQTLNQFDGKQSEWAQKIKPYTCHRWQGHTTTRCHCKFLNTNRDQASKCHSPRSHKPLFFCVCVRSSLQHLSNAYIYKMTFQRLKLLTAFKKWEHRLHISFKNLKRRLIVIKK